MRHEGGGCIASLAHEGALEYVMELILEHLQCNNTLIT